MALAIFAAPARGNAQPAVDPKVAAQALFDEGQRLVGEKKYAEACAKFEESDRLEHALGTMLNLGDCYEKTGRTAKAWGEFKDAADTAHAAGDSREAYARRRAAALEPRLSKLTVHAPDASAVAGLEIKVDGVVVGPALLGVPFPIDPGAHRIEVSAPGRRTWSTNANVEPDGSIAVVNIPALESAPSQPVPPEPSATTAAPAQAPVVVGSDQGTAPRGSSLGTQKIAGIALAGVGVAGLVVGTVFGLSASSKNDDALSHCRTSTLCDATGLALTDDAKTAATISTIGFIAGGAALAGGAILFFTAPKQERAAARVRLVPTVTARSAGLTLGGAW